MSDIDRADKLMKESRNEEAKSLLTMLLQKNPTQKSLYQEAVNIYLEGKMYKEVKEAFGLYKEKTGKELTGVDFRLEDIEREEQESIEASREYQDTSVKVFKRMSIKERGMGGSPTFLPVKEIKIHEDKIILKQGLKEYSYNWSEILDAAIISREKSVRYLGNYVQKVFVLKCPGKTFKFDVSSNYPEFKHSNILVNELRKHLNVRKGKIKKEVPWWVLLIILVIFALLLRRCL